MADENDHWREIIKKQDALIGELADWLEGQIEHMGSEYKEAEALIERARKSING